MRNLVVLSERGGGASFPGGCEWSGPVCVDASSETAFACARCSGGRLFLVALSLAADGAALPDAEEAWRAPVLADGDEPVSEGDAVVGLEYLCDRERVLVALSSGLLVAVAARGAEGGAGQALHDDAAWDPVAAAEGGAAEGRGRVEAGACEVVAEVGGGLAACEWSPDQELCAMATSEGRRLVLMTSEWDLLYDVPLDGEGEAEAGAEADAEAGGHPAEPRLDWTGDGQALACQYAARRGGRRVLAVFDRNAARTASSEKGAADGMAPLVAWRPDGSVVASTERRRVGGGAGRDDYVHQVIFFEFNGLRHREFDLPDPACETTALAWNCDSSVLAVAVRPGGGGDEVVQLWTRRNYHWYLKLCVRGDGAVHALRWDPEEATRLLVARSGGRLGAVEMCWDDCVSPDASRTAAVVCGDRVLLTPLARALVPPPMSAHEWALGTVPAALALGPGGEIAAVVPDTGGGWKVVVAWRPDGGGERSEAALSGAAASGPFAPRHLCWPRPGTLLLVAGGDVLCELDARRGSPSFGRVTASGPAGGSVLRVSVPEPGGAWSCAAVQLRSGVVLRATPDGGAREALRAVPAGSLPAPCPWFCLVSMGGAEHAAGLDLRSKLYIDSTLISPQCLSLDTRAPVGGHQFLAFTVGGRQNAMFFLNLADTLEANLRPEARADPHAVRYTERGSRIVAVVDDDRRPRVVLQLPRGNLEAVHPRLLTLGALSRALRRGDYAGALRTARANRVDLNLLYDHDGAAFLRAAGRFVRDTRDPDLLNLFLSALSSDDVTKTEYPAYHATFGAPGGGGREEEEGEEDEESTPVLVNDDDDDDDSKLDPRHAAVRRRRAAVERLERPSQPLQQQQQQKQQQPDKVNAVCAAVRQAALAEDPERLVLTVLTSYAMERPPNLEQALRVVQLRQGDAGRALKYLIFLADVNRLFDVALGMYDFGLVLAVAKHSQKDPREYLPFLQRLQGMEPPALMRCEIDKHLGRWGSALANLASAGPGHVDGCLELIEQHGLFEEAFRIYAPPGDPAFGAAAPPGARVRPQAATPAPIAQPFADHHFWRASTSFLVGGGELELDDGDDDDGDSKKLVGSRPSPWHRVMELYAESEADSDREASAGRAYEAAGNLAKAVQMYARAGCVGECFSCAARLGTEGDELVALAESAASSLVDVHGRRSDAARVLLDFGGGAARADEAACLLAGDRRWAEAERVAAMAGGARGREVMARQVLPLLDNDARRLVRRLERHRSEFVEVATRLRAVRRQKLESPDEDDLPAGAAAGDTAPASDASSVASGFTLGTQSVFTAGTGTTALSSASSLFTVHAEGGGEAETRADRRRRAKARQRRKRSKRGQRHEEPELLGRLRRLMPTARMREQTLRTVDALARHGRLAAARSLRAALDALERDVLREERTPMPRPPRGSPELAHRLAAQWRWPEEVGGGGDGDGAGAVRVATAPYLVEPARVSARRLAADAAAAPAAAAAAPTGEERGSDEEEFTIEL